MSGAASEECNVARPDVNRPASALSSRFTDHCGQRSCRAEQQIPFCSEQQVPVRLAWISNMHGGKFKGRQPASLSDESRGQVRRYLESSGSSYVRPRDLSASDLKMIPDESIHCWRFACESRRVTHRHPRTHRSYTVPTMTTPRIEIRRTGRPNNPPACCPQPIEPNSAQWVILTARESCKEVMRHPVRIRDHPNSGRKAKYRGNRTGR